MTSFQVHDVESAPEGSRAALEKARAGMGRIPNLFGVFAESPAMLNAYTELSATLEKSTLFDATELQVVLLTASYENECDYCMAAHSAIATMKKVEPDVLQRLRDGAPLQDSRLEALRTFTRAVVEERGFVSAEDVAAFLGAGYERRHLLEVVLGVGLKTLSNYTNHVARTPLDDAFRPFAWARPKATES